MAHDIDLAGVIRLVRMIEQQLRTKGLLTDDRLQHLRRDRSQDCVQLVLRLLQFAQGRG